MDAKVGIVVVTFNRSDVTNLALDSLLRARNERSRFKVFLVDNASSLVEFQRIERFFSYLCAQHGLDGVLTRNEQNLGYAAGNNVGIRQALADPQITHLCLLNNDVIVSDGWLDRLVEKAPGALVGPVSNCVGNEQLISVDYQSQGTNGHTTLEVQKFARRWAEEHRGNVEGSRMLGFFCVLGERQLFESVGLLDENFRLGFFEDDDYCLRCVKAGWLLRIVREAFVHHWGSASFSRLPPAEFSALFRRNRQLFEEKHGAKWTQPSHDSWQRALVHELT
jgi:GT2 family glycosyltransferase